MQNITTKHETLRSITNIVLIFLQDDTINLIDFVTLNYRNMCERKIFD